MKNMRKILSLVLALVMVLSLSVTAFATEVASEYTVTIHVKEVWRDKNGALVDDEWFTEGSPITVSVDAGDNLKTAIVKACQDNNSAISNDHWNTTYPEYLTSLTYNTTDYTNKDSYKYDYPTEGKATYTGTSWMFFEGTNTPASAYADYPEKSLEKTVVNGDITITLSFEHLTYEWDYTE